MFRLIVTIVLFLTLLVDLSQAQDKESNLSRIKARNNFSIGGGTMNVYLLNYERILFQKQRNLFGLTLGMGFLKGRYPKSLTNNLKFYTWAFPIEVFYAFSDRIQKNHVEAGLGYVYSEEDNFADSSNATIGDIYKYTAFNNYLYLRAGYRKQNLKSGFFFKGGINLIFFSSENNKGNKEYPYFRSRLVFLPHPYFGLGWSF